MWKDMLATVFVLILLAGLVLTILQAVDLIHP